MSAKRIPARLRRYAALIEEIEDYRDQGEGGDGYWVHLVPGYVNTLTETHAVHEDNITQCEDIFKSRFVQPCRCAQCQKALARLAATSKEAQ